MEINNKKESQEKKFLPNNQYFTISIYVLVVVAISALIIRVVMTPYAVSSSIKQAINVVMPFIIGFLIAFVLNPLIKKMVEFLHKFCRIKSKKVCKGISIAVAYFLVVGLLLVCIMYIVPQIIVSITDVVNGLPKLTQSVYDFVDTLQERFPSVDMTQVQTMINDTLPDVVSWLRKFAGNLVPTLYNVSVSVVNWILDLVIALIASVYMQIDKKNLLHSFRRIIYSFVPVKWIDLTMEILSECNKIFTSFIVGKAIDSTIIGILCFILMNIFKMPYALLISVIVGVTNMIPYFGPFIGAIPGIIVLLVVNPLTSLGFAIMIFLLQQFDGLYLGPKILGDTVGMKPLWIIISITLGGTIAGVLGMFLSVPLVAFLRYLLNLYLDYRLKKQGIAESDIP